MQVNQAIELYQLFLSHHHTVGSKPKTILNYENFFRTFWRYCQDKPFDRFTTQQFLSEKLSRGCALNTLRDDITKLRAFLNFLEKNQYLKHEDNFATLLERPKEQLKDLPLLSSEEVERLILMATTPGAGDNCRNRAYKACYREAMNCAYQAGLRSQEIIKMKCEDVLIDGGLPFAKVTSKKKGTDFDMVPLPVSMLPFFQERALHKGEKVFSFESKLNGKPVRCHPRNSGLNDAVQRGCKQLGIKPFNFHDLRHYFAIHLLREGVELHNVKQLMRHESVETTMRYYSQYDLKRLSHEMNLHHPMIVRHTHLSFDDMLTRCKDALKDVGINPDNIMVLFDKQQIMVNLT